ncbi:MAG: TIGR04283 family arsenosugar biosynthesis glycosyltransferase [Clostridiales bacterium]|nr:TIGR04283 family arsenosugar biosynthesis glycosyltransferase [Candidatus Crickella merdequi]
MIKSNNDNALIIFSREPLPGKTKTRLMPYYSPEQCAELHRAFLKDYKMIIEDVPADIMLYHTGGEPAIIKSIFGDNAEYHEQKGDTLGIRMKNAIADALGRGYQKVVLIGTDIPELQARTIEDAFYKLDDTDIVIGPTFDGGYYLIGMKAVCETAFNVDKYGDSTVFDNTVRSICEAGLSIEKTDTYSDIDDREDLLKYCGRMRISKNKSRTFTSGFVFDNLTVSIIVPVYNEEKIILRMMEQLRPYKDDAEILFVDGGSTDSTLMIIGNEFTVIRSAKGRANQMNTGAIKASGDILMFLHCDSIIPENLTKEIRDCLSSNQYGCFGIDFESRHPFIWTNKVISNHRAWQRGLPFGDQGIFIDRELFFEVGMFPELPIMEDYEFGMRLKAKGIKPGRTENRIVTSSRRYGQTTMSILRTEYRMWKLRRLYRMGVDINRISEIYRDIR